MGTVSGLSKARMLAIEAKAIISGIVSGDNLVLTAKDGSTVVAGNVRGPKGDTGSVSSGTVGGDLQGNFPNPTLSTARQQQLVPTGAVFDFAGSSAPAGYLLCQGQAVSRSTYAALYTAIGTTYGTGDGSTTFNLPDARDRGAVGASSTKALGTTGGSATKTIGATNLPPHAHDITHSHGFNGDYRFLANTPTGSNNSANGSDFNRSGLTATQTQSATSSGNGPGSSTPLDTQDPYLALNKIIKT